MTFNPSDLLVVAPEIAILALAILVILVELVITRKEGVLQLLTAVGLIATMAIALLTSGSNGEAFNGMIAADGFSSFLYVLLCGVALLAVLMSGDYLRGTRIRHGEYYGMVLLATCGMMILASSTDMITLFLGIETMSIALYVLAGIRSERERSSEAALKYFLLGAFSTGFLLYGIALIYGATGGVTNLSEIGHAIGDFNPDNPAPVHLYAGVGLLMIGLLFKVAAVPFHFWSPDVYQGSPTPITAFMSAGPKAAALVAFIRVFGWALPDISTAWAPVLGVIAAATMIVGNIIALSQRDIKRMLAYSSISHAGYLLLAVLASADIGVRSDAAAGLIFYLTAYYLMNIGAFTVAILVSRAQEKGDYQIDDYQGLASRHPMLAAVMALFMISLTGIPPTAGFFGKLYVFSAAVNANLVVLVVIAVLASVVSAYYYLRIVVYMYMKPQINEARVGFSPMMVVVLVVCALGVLKLGLLPGYLMDWANRSAEKMEIHAPSIAVEAHPQADEG